MEGKEDIRHIFRCTCTCGVYHCQSIQCAQFQVCSAIAACTDAESSMHVGGSTLYIGVNKTLSNY